MEETQVSFLIREDPTRLEATKPVSHSYEVCALELVPHSKASPGSEKPAGHSEGPAKPKINK